MIDEPEAAVWFGAVLAEPANVCEAEKLLLMLSRLTLAERRASARVPLVRSDASVVGVPASSSLPVMGLKT
jgi:hypothetical protein